MASKEQELQIALSRIASGTASDADRANVDYARKTGLLPAESTPVVNTSQGATGDLSGTLESLNAPVDSLDNLKLATKKAAQAAYNEGGGAKRGLNMASEAGLNLFNPESIRGAINAGSADLKGDIKDIYSLTLDKLTSQDKARKEGSAYIGQLAAELPDFFSQITPEEIKYIQQTGMPSYNTMLKLAQYKQNNPESEKSIVASWAEKYSDAGISLSDSLDDARAKIQNSSIYQQSVRLASGGGSGTSEPTVTSGFFNFDTEKEVRSDLAKLKSDGNSNEEIFSILRSAYSPQEATDSALFGLIGMSPVGGSSQEESSLPGEVRDLSTIPTILTTEEGAKTASNQAYIDNLIAKAKSLLTIINSPVYTASSKNDAKKQLAQIPQNYNGTKIY